MPLETNFNTPPYYDDFDANNNFYRILFRPSTAVQARELTQLQSILQDQVEKFGKHIFVDGTIIEGCAIYFDNKYDYVKILDNYSNGTSISSLTDFVNKRLISSNTGLEAIILNSVAGYESSAPDLNTLYIKYLKSGEYANGVQQKKFDPSDVLDIRTTANVTIGTIIVGNNTVNSIGYGYSLTISEGTIFQKGVFIRVEPQTLIVSKYDNQPNGVSVGFRTIENIVTADSDSSLLDNALGAPNYNAPGANRLQLTPILVVRETANTSLTALTANTDTFFSIVDFEGGSPTVVKTDAEYANLGKQLAKRTYEESGHYIVDPFELAISANTSNSTYHALSVDKGLGYVQGYRVEYLNKKTVPIKKGIDTNSVDNQVVSTNFGNYINVDEFAGTFDADAIPMIYLVNTAFTAITSNTNSSTTIPANYSNNNVIGSAYVRSVVHQSGTPGTNNAIYSLYLFGIKMKSGKTFGDAKGIAYPNVSANGVARIILDSNNKAVLTDSKFDRLVFPVGSFAISNTSDRSYTTRRTKKGVTFVGGSYTLSSDVPDTGYIFSDTSSIGGTLSTSQELNFIIIPTQSNTGVILGKPISLVSNGSITYNSTTSVTINTGISSNFTADIIYNAIKPTSTQSTKQLQKDLFVVIRANTHPAGTTGPWSLGIPEGHALKAVYQGTTISTSNPNNSRYFIFDKGQRDFSYEHASISLSPSAGGSVGSNDYLLVQFDAFQSTSGDGYFTVDSYPVDDITPFANNTIKTPEIPVFQGITGTYDLRDCVDYRPIRANTATYSNTSGGATTNPASSNTFSTISRIPIPDGNLTLDYSFYLGRKDKITMTSTGKINVIEGIPSLSPITPKDQEGSMTLGVVTIPPYPSLTQAESKLYNRYDYTITQTLQQNRRYTMRDIGGLDQRINNLEYYTLLSAIESSTDAMLISDENGINRFKNGIFVDPFNDFKIANTSSIEWKAAIDTKNSILRPKFYSSYVPLKEKTLTNVTKNNTTTILNYNHVPFVTQPYASLTRNCAEALVFVWNGSVLLSPDGDHVPDVKYNPDIVVDIDLATPLLKLAEGGFFNTSYGTGWQTVNSQDVVTSSNVQETNRIYGSNGIGFEQYGVTVSNITTTTQQVQDIITANFSASNQTFNFGEIVQDVSVQPFMRSRRVTFVAYGMKPNTIVYPFFDEKAVNLNCKAGSWNGSIVIDSGEMGSQLKSDSVGTVYGVFYLPENTFKTGERMFKLVDAQNLTTEASTISTIATALYTGSNITISKANASVNVKSVDISQTVTQIQQTVVTQRTDVSEEQQLYVYDPIAQSFSVSDPSTNIPGVFITKIDLYFFQKHPTLGVEVQVREVDVDTGYPTPNIVPNGRKIISVNDIITSSDASSATTVEFNSPLYLETDRQYCFVVIPQGNNTETKIWVANIGGTDVTTGASITTNNPMGDLFTSSTNKVWVADIKQDIKCVIYRADFTSQTGSITYRNDDVEYMTVNNRRGTFLDGEKVYVSNGIITVGSGAVVNSTLSNSIVIGTTIAQSAFSVGNRIYISSNTGVITDIKTITALPNTTNIRVDSSISFVDNNASIGKLFSNGSLTGVVDYNNPTDQDLYLTSSTANASVNFTNTVFVSANALLIGETSRARANLVSLDDITYSVTVPQLAMARPPGTFVNLSIKGTANNSTTIDSSAFSVENDIETELVDKERRILSRSREWSLMGGNNSFELTASLNSSSSKLSPIFDDIKKTILVIKNDITSGNTIIANNETYPLGNNFITSKYVSSKVILADGQDSEDLIVYLTASKPDGTDIYVYAKFLGAEDSENFDTKYWTLLTQITPSNVVSSKVNLSDYKEYRYELPTGTNSTTTKTAFKNTDNFGIIRYYTNSGSYVDTYKYFAIKIVMVSNSGSQLIPRIADMRSIALQV